MAGFGSLNNYQAPEGFYTPGYGDDDDDAAATGTIAYGGMGPGYSVVQPDGANTSFQVVKPDFLPTTQSSTGVSQNKTSTSGGSSGKSTTSGTNTGTTTGKTVTQGNSTSTRTGNNTSTGQSSSTTDRMTPDSRAAYDQLLAQLVGGGTDAMKAGTAELEALMGRSRNAESQYTADQARAQAQKALPSYARQLREEIMPTIHRAAGNAGLSGDALTALLAQDQVTRVSEAANAAELSAIQAYGELYQGQQGITGSTAEALMQDPAAEALNQLLNTGISAYEQVETNSIVNDIINEVTSTQSEEVTDATSTTNETSSQTTDEETESWEDVLGNLTESNNQATNYTSTGGSGSGAAQRGLGSSTANQTGQEAMATLLAALGPFQNLQDVNRTGGASNAFMSGTSNSGQQIRDLAASLGVQL